MLPAVIWLMMEGSENRSPTTLRQVWADIRRGLTSRAFVVFTTRLVLIELAVILLLGFGVAFIVHGLLMIVFRLSPHVAQARRAVSLLIRPYSIGEFLPSYPLKWWAIPAMVLRITAWLLLSGVGIWFIVRLGVCAQNFACLLLQSK